MNSTVESSSLWAVFQQVPDTRQASGRRYPLRALLSVAMAAGLAGRTTLVGIYRWAKKLPPPVWRSLGVWRGRAPSHAAWHYVFRDLDIVAVEAALGTWVGAHRPSAPLLAAALDGKCARGSATASAPALHLVALYCEAAGGVLGEWRVPPEANEIVAALTMLRTMSLDGLVLTGDAMFAQRELCEEIQARGGEYFFVVKGNQPALRESIEAAFAPPSSPLGRARVGA